MNAWIFTMTKVNAFDWMDYTEQERARRGDPLAEVKRNAEISRKVANGINRLRERKPSHGTILGITEKSVSTKPPEMMRKSNAKTKN